MPATQDPARDIATLKAKYKEERDKRIRPEGNDQYREVAGALALVAADPNADHQFLRAPIAAEIDALVIGGGFGGLLAAARLRECGVKDIRVVERGSDFGGTWYWNRYPNAACDIESYIYLPLLEEVGYVLTEKYAKGPEIFAHAQTIGRHYGLYADAMFQTDATDLAWNDREGIKGRIWTCYPGSFFCTADCIRTNLLYS
ncbi:MAG: FAD-binding protein [Cytophagaceae bacterium]|nr:MAG: FAD-binding protein [Cytophagaceae bacterium]